MKNSVCIIDDDHDIRNVMCFALEFEGIKTLPFENGIKALSYLSQLDPNHYPCLILVDFTMPGMDGVEFISHIRSTYPDTLGKVPVGLSTARYPDEISNLPAGVFQMEKPIDLQDFIDIAKKHVHSHEMISSVSGLL